MNLDTAPDDALRAFATEYGLMRPGEVAHWTPLPGGVSSDIWRLDLPGRSICMKRALGKLRVEADWRAPVERNASEWAWFEAVNTICPGAAPRLLAHDAQRGVFAMEFLPCADYPLWKQQLLDGHADPDFAARVGDVLGTIHSATAGDAGIAKRFGTDASFRSLRIEPYLLATAARRPEVGRELCAVAERTQATRRALVHGDVSPKNILIGPCGPVFLDAECAWYGDPAFDVAFCLNHLALKALVRADIVGDLERSHAALIGAYKARADWEPGEGLEERVSTLLPALMLARVDGKSPVEYLNPAQQDIVRSFAIRRIKSRSPNLWGFYADWRKHLGRDRFF